MEYLYQHVKDIVHIILTHVCLFSTACNVLFLNSVDTESLTGPEAIARAVKETLRPDAQRKTTVVHFKVASQGITLTDNKRK